MLEVIWVPQKRTLAGTQDRGLGVADCQHCALPRHHDSQGQNQVSGGSWLHGIFCLLLSGDLADDRT